MLQSEAGVPEEENGEKNLLSSEDERMIEEVETIVHTYDYKSRWITGTSLLPIANLFSVTKGNATTLQCLHCKISRLLISKYRIMQYSNPINLCYKAKNTLIPASAS